MNLHDIPVVTLAGTRTTLGEYAGRALLVVNVASRCGLTPQYAGLERLQEGYADRSRTEPESDEVVDAIEAVLAAQPA